MKNLRFYIVELLALLAVSCTDNPVVEYSGDELQITGSLDFDSRTTFVQGEGVIETHWEVDDEIGLWTEEQSNLKYKALNEGKASTFQPALNKKLENKDGQNVYAYYPYTTGIRHGDYISLPSTVEYKYKQDEVTPFMYSQGQINDGKLDLQFKHLFAYLKIKISVQNIKDAFSDFQSVTSIENGGMILLHFGDTLSADIAFYNLKTNEYTGKFSDRIKLHFDENIDFDSDDVYTYLVPVLPVSEPNILQLGFFFGRYSKPGEIDFDIPHGGIKAGHVYNLDLTDNKEASDELYEALESFYVKTGGDQWWHKDNWLSDKPLNEWYGINTGPLKYRTLRRLDFSNQNLKGPFPEEVAAFMETADYIDLSTSYLTGPIPEKVKNHRKWDKLGWRMIRQFQTKGGQLDLTNSNLYVRDMNLDYLFEGDTQRPRTLHEFIKQNQLTQVFKLFGQDENLESALKYINEERINQHLDYQKKGLKAIIFCSSSKYSREQLKKKISQHYGELEGVEWVYGIAPIKGFYFHNSYVFDSNCQLVYNADYNIGCPTWDNDWVHYKLSEFFRSQLGEPSEHPKFAFGLTSTDFSKDGEVFVIQEATTGKGINIVFLGEGYIDQEMQENGLYENTMKEAAEILFSVEPYKSFRDRFNVYGVKVVSPYPGYMDGEHGINEDNAVCFDYFKKIPNSDKNPPMVSVIYRNFTWGEHMGRSHTYTYEDGSFVAYMYHGVDEANVLIHETGGHGIGLLLDEYVESGNETKTLPEEKKDYLDKVWSQIGRGANVDWRNDKATVKWAHFLKDSRYAKEGLGLYEGSYLYGRGAYRPSVNSMMRHNDGPFNAPSREAIYKRIMKLSEGEDWKYDYEEFVKNDKLNSDTGSRSVVRPLTEAEKKEYVKKHCPPILMKGTWRDAIRNGNRKVVVPFR